MKILLTIFGMMLAVAPTTKQKILFFGDSITEAGAKPGGYILKTADLAARDHVGDRFEFIGAGIGGNKVYDLYLRLEDDALARMPDVVVIYIGVNDVWHKRTFGTGTDADKFEKFYLAMIRKFQAKNIRVVVCTPAVIGEKTDFSDELDGDLNKYSNIIRALAAKESLPLVDLRKAFLEYNRNNNPENKESGILTTDRVHLNEKGNQLVAEEMWNVIKSL
jgi:lysophospholipase L1-like esterase